MLQLRVQPLEINEAGDRLRGPGLHAAGEHGRVRRQPVGRHAPDHAAMAARQLFEQAVGGSPVLVALVGAHRVTHPPSPARQACAPFTGSRLNVSAFAGRTIVLATFTAHGSSRPATSSPFCLREIADDSTDDHRHSARQESARQFILARSCASTHRSPAIAHG